MSLDVSLYDPTSTYEPTQLYWGNITHNLGSMAVEAGIYKPLWRPEEINATEANHISWLVREGLERMKADPERFKKYDSPNKWGTYDQFIPFIEEYLEALEKFPKAIISVSR